MMRRWFFFVSLMGILTTSCDSFESFTVDESRFRHHNDSCADGERGFTEAMMLDGEEQILRCISRSCIHGEWVDDAGESKNSQRGRSEDEVLTAAYNLCEAAVSCKMEGQKFSGCGECLNGASQCEDREGTGYSKACARGMWSVDWTECDSGFSCQGDSCGACRNGVREYKEKNGVCYYADCADGKYGSDVACIGYVSCVNAEGELSCGECYNGDRMCRNDENNHGVIHLCQNGKWVAQSEPSCGDLSCHGSGCGTCLEKDKRYVDVSGVCRSNTCSDGVWMEDVRNACEDGISCRMGETSEYICGTCQNYAERCVPDADGRGWMQSCQKGIWKNVDSCSEDGDEIIGCNASFDGCDRCTVGAVRYENVRKLDRDVCVRKTCAENGQDWNSETCPEEVSCLIGSNGKPEACGECRNYVQECQNDRMMSCFEGTWHVLYSCGDVSCNPEANTCGVCRDGDIRYQNDEHGICTKSTCNQGAWESSGIAGCNNSCRNNTEENPCGECIDGSHTCSSDSGFAASYECIQGEWLMTNKCESGMCNGDSCAECEEGSTQGHNVHSLCVIEKCKNGVWEIGENCTGSCRYDNNSVQCGECVDGNNRCSGSAHQQCSQGHWRTINECVMGCDAETGCSSGECKTGEQKCENQEDGIGKYTECIDGILKTSLCSEVSCSDNQCGECLNNSSSICKDDENQLGALVSCEKGMWRQKESCGQVSCNGKNCGDCHNGTTKIGTSALGKNSIERCVDGKWMHEPCANSIIKSDDGQFACGECRTGDTKLMNGVGGVCGEFKCDNGSWRFSSNPCEYSCSGGLGGVVIKTDEQSKINDLTPITVESSCGSCLDGSTLLSNNYSWKICVNGKWATTLKCGAEMVRVGMYYYCPKGNSNPRVSCTQSAENSIGKKVEYSKQGDVYVVLSQDIPCDNGASCHVNSASSIECGKCLNETSRCNGDNWEYCHNGVWETKRKCAFGCVDNGCVEDYGVSWFH